jgi:hypothetical protein
MNAMPQLNEAESKFFASRGQEMAPTLLESPSEREEPAGEVGAAEDATDNKDWAPASAGVTKTEAGDKAAEKENRQERFVPLQALQEERAEKKQLREELRQYREWQAQLAQRLQQMPIQRQGQQVPDPQTKPLDYINHVLGNVQATTAELQQWRQQQEQAAQQRAAVQQATDWASAQEQEFAKGQPEYHEAYRYAADARDKELQALGYTDPAARAAIVRQNTAEIINNAIQQSRNPAELVWEYAQARGYTPKAKRSSGNTDAHSKIAAGLQAAGAKLNQGGATGDAELSAKDLANISDPEEFEKAWQKIFGKRR